MEANNPGSPGTHELDILISTLEPKLDPANYVFCVVSNEEYQKRKSPFPQPWATIREDEGVTQIISQHEADRMQLKYCSVWRKITCMVHSSLDAVGLTAALSTKLAEHTISANIVAGFYHDHLFVQAERANEAMQLLIDMQKGVT